MTKIDHICTAVCKEFEVAYSQLMSRRRPQDIADARAVAMTLAEELGEERKNVAAYFSRDRSLLFYANRKVNDLRQTYPAFARKLTAIREELKGME